MSHYQNPYEYISINNLNHDTLVELNNLVHYYVIQQRKQLTNILQGTLQSHRCVARIQNNTQCSRKCKNAFTPLCGSHIKSIPYGRIDTINNDCPNIHHNNNDDVDLSLYVRTQLINIGGVNYLIDDNNIIFENNDTNTILAQKLSDDNIKWF